MADAQLAVLGAALPIAGLADYREWILADQRDVEIQDPALPDALDGDRAPLVRQARAALDGHTGRVGIHGPFDGLSVISKDKKVRALAVERLCQGLDFGAELGATHMVVHSPFMFFGSPFLPHSTGFEREQQLLLVHETLDPVLARADQMNCTLVIEGIQDKHPAPLLALVASFKSERVRMSLDIGHALITERQGGPPPDLWVREAGDLLGHLHLQDSDGNIDRHWAPGKGSLNWHALFEALGTLRHRPRLILELKQKGELRQAAAWLADRGLAR